ncbi:MAG: hypothetical protein HYU26_06310 [Candidatus Rokubacteria bacterium]|nr:hypothetical protein [Candidatus Rokubacteria bacterium]
MLLVEAPPGVGKSHVAMTLARWSGDAYLLTSQKLLQDQYEREFGPELQLVKGRDNYLCERYPGARVPTSRGMCRRPRGPFCQCPYARAKAAALAGPIFCTNTSYFATLRHWQAEQLRKRRLLVIDEAHNLEAQLAGVFTVAFAHDEMRAWFGAPLPRLPAAEDYRRLMADRLADLEGRREAIGRAGPSRRSGRQRSPPISSSGCPRRARSRSCSASAKTWRPRWPACASSWTARIGNGSCATPTRRVRRSSWCRSASPLWPAPC